MCPGFSNILWERLQIRHMDKRFFVDIELLDGLISYFTKKN